MQARNTDGPCLTWGLGDGPHAANCDRRAAAGFVCLYLHMHTLQLSRYLTTAPTPLSHHTPSLSLAY